MSTSAIAEGKIQVARNRGEQLPEGCTIDAAGNPNRDPAMFYGPPAGRAVAVGGHKGYGLSIFCEILAGALSGGQTTNPDNATAWRLVNNMMSVSSTPQRSAARTRFRAEIARLAAWVKASPPATPGGEVLLPGEIERRTRAQRESDGISLDAVTRRQIADSVRTLAVALPPGLRHERRGPLQRSLPLWGRRAAPRGLINERAGGWHARQPGTRALARRWQRVRRHGVRVLHARARAGARRRGRGVRAARHGAQRRRHRDHQGADRACPRRRHRADGARAGVRLSR